MIKSLKINQFALIKGKEIEFSDSLNIITGESGSGKSLILKSLQFLIGSKIDDVYYESKLDVEGQFDINKIIELKEILKQNDLLNEEDNNFLILRRVYDKNSKIYINGHSATLNLLKSLSNYLFDFCSQNENIKLKNENYQIQILDKYTQNFDLLLQISNLYKKITKIKEENSKFEQENKNKDDNTAYIKYQLKELESFKNLKNINVKELEENLIKQKEKQKNEHVLTKLLNFYNECDLPSVLLSNKMPNTIYNKDLIDKINILIDTYDATFQSIKKELKNLSSSNNTELASLMDDYNKVVKKFGSLESFIIKIKEYEDKLNYYDSIEQKIKKNEIELKKYLNDFFKSSKELSIKRIEANKKFCSLISEHLNELNIKNSILDFKIQFNENLVTMYGSDKFDFSLSTNKGIDLKPISKIASGGELSRLMLCIFTVMNEKLENTIIFDEIDTGLGGETGFLMGKKIYELSLKNQIIMISHLPQVASFSDNHIVVSKSFNDKETVVNIESFFNQNDKNIELKRMMGNNIDELTTNNFIKELIKKTMEIKNG